MGLFFALPLYVISKVLAMELMGKSWIRIAIRCKMAGEMPLYRMSHVAFYVHDTTECAI
jgi:hypothetical protein